MSGLFDIITVGSNTLDVFVETKAEFVDVTIHVKGKRTKKERCMAYPLGAKILIKELDFEIGGGGTNTAVSFSRLGLKTAYLGKIGHDNSGIQVYNLLHKENIEFLGSFGQRTGFSVVLDSQAEDRTILTFKGCNDEFDLKEINKKLLNTKWFYFSSMMNSSLDSLDKLAHFANKKKIKVAFNPSKYLIEKGKKQIHDILLNTNVLILNKEEAQTLSGKTSTNDILVYLKRYAKDYVIVTDGRAGCSCYDGKMVYSAVPKKNLHVVETTGAGDAFASAFTAALIQKKDIKTAIKMAMLQSESVIQYKGAKNILLTKKQMAQVLKLDNRLIKSEILNSTNNNSVKTLKKRRKSK